ncbi:MAG TPA: endolytic transglycosylase MltG [Candidatus Jorgensenbacteria bacterium]|nr:endolytic transglycosylase MltG [Candidatus Jorgensenbacteria bacterium]
MYPKHKTYQEGTLRMRLLVVLGAVIVSLVALGYFFYGLQPTATADSAAAKAVAFNIDRGDSFRNIGARLSQAKLIKSITVFKLYALLSGRAQRFQPGVYELSAAMSVPAVINSLTTAGANEVMITLPEGVTLKDIETLLVDMSILKEGALERFSFISLVQDYPFLDGALSLEGFLFPDTYRFERDSSPEQVVRVLLNTFSEKAWPLLRDAEEWYGVLILASLLEREVPEFEDRRTVAGILWKRLGASVLLQVDATLSYIKCDGRLLTCEDVRVLRADLQLISPYNMYRHPGLTPTPIANPGEEAIRAALNPAPSPYWYYLSSVKTKETIFSRTLEEHNQNRVLHL